MDNCGYNPEISGVKKPYNNNWSKQPTNWTFLGQILDFHKPSLILNKPPPNIMAGHSQSTPPT